MPWPLASDFQTILQNPKIAFRDPYLRSCSIERDLCGQPRAWAGSFAVVYKGIDATGNPLAIRVFSTESPHRRGRYEKIGEYLAERRLACLVPFNYRQEEIRCLNDGKRYPVLLMDWVEGETLFQWVQNQCHCGNVAAIVTAAQEWPAVTAELSRQQIAHGDLQHANIMVTPQGELKLVDYDGMCVPALVGADCLEVGTPPYQHPQRSMQARLSLRLDDFSALLIYVGLQALAADPTLWGRYVEQTNNDKLLFREDDFRFPQRSALRRELLNSPESHVRDMARSLFAAAAGELDQVPPVGELLQQEQRPLPAIPRDWQVPQAATYLPGARRQLPLTAGKEPTSTRTVPPMPKVPGYEMLAELGKGALGKVFLAKSELTGQHVAVKVVPIKTAATELVRRRFLAEMERATQARHDNIAVLIERGAIGHAFYFVGEYCPGGNILQWMELSGGKLRPGDVRPVVQQCLDALKHAHLHRLVHGNITPQNLLFRSAEGPRVVKLSDFALATQFARNFSSPPNRLFDLNAAGFMPPERLTSEHGLNSRSDLWSLAAVFYYAVSGAYPWDFGGRNPLDVILLEEPIPLGQREHSLPPSVAQVIDRALRPNPAHRYQSAAAMKAAWDAASNTAY